jgi:hypothetical protein
MSPTIGKLALALAKAQGTFTFAKKESEAPVFESKERGGRPVGKRTYADLAAVLEAVRKGLSENELAIIQTPFPQSNGGVLLRTTLAHSSGEWMASEISLPADRMGAIQGWGSALTYARRYALAAMVGIAQDDDDGQAAQDGEKQRTQKRIQETRRAAEAQNPDALSSKQLKALMARLNELGCKEREDYLVELSNVLGRTVETSKSLTVAEFKKFMDATQPQPVSNGNDAFEDIPDMPDFGAYGEVANA